jgi:hypothetical protein
LSKLATHYEHRRSYTESAMAPARVKSHRHSPSERDPLDRRGVLAGPPSDDASNQWPFHALDLLALETVRRERDRRDFLISRSESFARYMRLRSFAEHLASRDYHQRSAPVDAMARALFDLCAELESEFSDSHLRDEIIASTLFEVDDK